MFALHHPSRNDRRQRSLARTRRAFTLLEVIVVVTIIALLATLVAPKLLKNIGSSKQKVAKAEVASIAQQVSLWMADNGYSKLPDDFELELLVEGDNSYLRAKDLIDPWENPYEIVIPGIDSDFNVVSYGSDSEAGGEGEDADVMN